MNQRRFVLAIAILVSLTAPVWSDGSFSIGIGGNFFLNDQGYLDAVSASYQHVLQDGLELNLGADLALNTQNSNAAGEKVPSFLIPVTMGLNFIFPGDVLTFVFGTGISPIFNFNPETDDEFLFYMGPFTRAEVRVRVHPIMSWLVSVQQDLQIGGNDWINGSTRVLTGINFALSPES